MSIQHMGFFKMCRKYFLTIVKSSQSVIHHFKPSVEDVRSSFVCLRLSSSLTQCDTACFTFLLLAQLFHSSLMLTAGFLLFAEQLTGHFISHKTILNPCLCKQLCN